MKINELVGKEIQLYPGDTDSKFGIIEDWNEHGMLIKITKSDSECHIVGKSHYISHSSKITFIVI